VQVKLADVGGEAHEGVDLGLRGECIEHSRDCHTFKGALNAKATTYEAATCARRTGTGYVY